MALSGRCAVLACVALVALPAAACSKDSKRPSAASASSASSGPASVPSSSTTTTTTAPASSGPCDGLAAPGSAINVTHADGDFNGDNTPDTLTVYGTGTASQPSPYHLQIELGDSKGIVDTAIADAATDNNQAVKALGGADITATAGLPPDGSGVEAFVEIGSGASDALVGVYQLIGCSLTRLTGPQGSQPSQFPIGGSVTHLDGLRCDGTAGGQRLVQLSAKSDDGVTYKTTESRLEVKAGVFSVLGSPITGTLGASDPSLQAFSSVDCSGVQAP